MPSHLFLLLILFTHALAMDFDCSRVEYERCVQLADPLVKEIHLIFPDNPHDIDLVCDTWNGFVDCLKRYTERCFTEQQRRQFNRAVENPIESVHQMCTQDVYQKEYLRYAPCMKSTITDRERCWPYYSLLVDQVEQGDVISKATLCCSHDRFKQCVVRETKRICDRGVANGPASRFSAQIVDKALSFLQEQCYNYIPNVGDCVNPTTTDNIPYSDAAHMSTAPSDTYPWSDAQAPETKEAPSVSGRSNGVQTNLQPPPSVAPRNAFIDPSTLATQTLGSWTRPASYGRSGSWAEPAQRASAQPPVNAVEVTTAPPTVAPTPNWSTVTTWRVLGRSTVDDNRTEAVTVRSTTETWYPAAGNQLSNEVDEPNQQGLTKENSGADGVVNSMLIFFILLILNMAA